MESNWFAFFRAGDYGPKGNWPASRLAKIVENYDPERAGIATLQIEHNNEGKPVFGFVDAVKLVGDTLWAKPREVVAGLVEMVRDRQFKGVSAQFNKKLDYLCHVAFLPESEPEVDGLPYPAFSKVHAGETETFCVTGFVNFSTEEPVEATGESAGEGVKRLTEEILSEIETEIAGQIGEITSAAIKREIKDAVSAALREGEMEVGPDGYLKEVKPSAEKQIRERIKAAVGKLTAEGMKAALKAFNANFSKGENAGGEPEPRRARVRTASFSAEDAMAYYDENLKLFAGYNWKRADFERLAKGNKLGGAMVEQIADFAKRRQGNKTAKETGKMKAASFSNEEKKEIMGAYYDMFASAFAQKSCSKDTFLRFGLFDGSMAEAVGFAREGGNVANFAGGGAAGSGAQGSPDKYERLVDERARDEKRKEGYWLANEEYLRSTGLTKEAWIKHGAMPKGAYDEPEPEPESFSKEDLGAYWDAHSATFVGAGCSRESFIKHGKLSKGAKIDRGAGGESATSFSADEERGRYYDAHSATFSAAGCSRDTFIKYGPDVPESGRAAG